MSSTVITDAWLQKVTDSLQSGSPAFDVAYFRIGEGGWYADASTGGVRTARDPDPTLSNLDCVENPSRYAADERYYFQKAITSDKIVEDSPTQVTVECVVSTLDANDDGTGLSPEFWELGIFDSDGTMITHTTFSRQPKDDTVALRHFITIAVARA